MKVSLWLKYVCAYLVLQFGTSGQQLSSTEFPLDLVKFGQQSILREKTVSIQTFFHMHSYKESQTTFQFIPYISPYLIYAIMEPFSLSIAFQVFFFNKALVSELLIASRFCSWSYVYLSLFLGRSPQTSSVKLIPIQYMVSLISVFHGKKKKERQIDQLLLPFCSLLCSWRMFVLGSISNIHSFRMYLNFQAPCVLYIGQAFRYSPVNAFYIFNLQIYFIICYLLDCASLI